MSAYRTLDSILEGVTTVDGAGVKLRRVFGFHERHSYDPFLLLDHFGSDDPNDYLAGFPWHPHRGIETVTYLLAGEVAHGDSMRNSGTIGPGDAQWMTAGSGIIHQEMPRPGADGRKMEGFQLWVNLPAAIKMTAPRYRSVDAAEIPRLREDGAEIAILAGNYRGESGATPDLFVPVLYLIVSAEPGAIVEIPFPSAHNAAVYVFRGAADISGTTLRSGQLGHLPARSEHASPSGSSDIVIAAADRQQGASFLFIAGQPLKEPVAWGGPIVMNTREELRQAFAEYEAGTFIKSRAQGL